MKVVETPFLKEPKGGFEFLKNFSIEEFVAVTRRLRVGYTEGMLLDTAYGSHAGSILVSFFQPVSVGVSKNEWLEIGPPGTPCVYEMRLDVDDTQPGESGSVRIEVSHERAGRIFETWVRATRAAALHRHDLELLARGQEMYQRV
ncbi:hypothetical protein F6X40_10465 [Paraburkholderia sp. UCT31]|uniref:hypothetical protein n=1 Tax=Paraburkholderia sp. UCT31 TaxID=2615209 RepID=UPI001654E006|nr:hypothetical protein [Paraburkholderia sp. UCT31]MBC8737230.1 hypothetical protein [Paraburkholderia sp. UCT31]